MALHSIGQACSFAASGKSKKTGIRAVGTAIKTRWYDMPIDRRSNGSGSAA